MMVTVFDYQCSRTIHELDLWSQNKVHEVRRSLRLFVTKIKIASLAKLQNTRPTKYSI